MDVRHGKVELRETELGRLLTAQRETEARLSSLRESQSRLLQELHNAQSSEIDLFKVGLLRLNLLEVNACIDSTSLELASRSQEVKKKSVELIEAKQSEETLEILKRKRHEVYVAEQLQIESRALDDIYIAQAFRNQVNDIAFTLRHPHCCN